MNIKIVIIKNKSQIRISRSSIWVGVIRVVYFRLVARFCNDDDLWLRSPHVLTVIGGRLVRVVSSHVRLLAEHKFACVEDFQLVYAPIEVSVNRPEQIICLLLGQTSRIIHSGE